MAGKSGGGRQAAAALFSLGLAYACAGPSQGAELRAKTVEGFDRYAKLTEAQIASDEPQGRAFLWVERLPDKRSAQAESQLIQGEVVIERLQTLDGGKLISCPGGMIHNWIGTVFIPGAALQQVLSFVQDYDHQAEYFRPDVVKSRILRHEDGNYLICLRFYKKKVVTSVVDTDHEVHYAMIDAAHARSWSRTTRVQQVDNAGKPDERLRPEGHDDGFLWKMNTYWRFEQKDGGTYVECQSVSLTRDIPTGLGWLIGPYVQSVPRESLTFTLANVRSGVLRSNRKPGR